MSVHFSIIIPVYNAEKTLLETLNWTGAQTYPHFEIICVNDGSTDGSEEIILQWKKDHPAIDFTLINQQNGGLGNARNRGIKAAKHPWVAFLDADDIWIWQRLELLSNEINQAPADVIYTSFKTFGKNNRPRVRKGHPLQNLKDLLVKGNPIMPSAAIAKTALLLEYPFSEDPDVHGAEDFDLWVRLLHDNKTFHYGDAPLTLYRETGGMSTRIPEHLSHVINVITKYHQMGWFDDLVFQKAIQRKNWEAGRYYHKNRAFIKALQHYAKAGSLNFKQKIIRLMAQLKVAS